MNFAALLNARWPQRILGLSGPPALVGLDRQQLAFDVGQMVARFRYEFVNDLTVVHCCTPASLVER